MYIEIKSNNNHHKAFNKFIQSNAGSVIVLNEQANNLNLSGLKAYTDILLDLEKYPKFCISNNILCDTIGYKKDKLAIEQKYKKRYNTDCWGFIIKEDISFEDLLVFGYYIFDKFKNGCLIYHKQNNKIYEITTKKHINDNTLILTDNIINKIKKLKKELIIKQLNNIKDNLFIYKYDLNSTVLKDILCNNTRRFICAKTQKFAYILLLNQNEHNKLDIDLKDIINNSLEIEECALFNKYTKKHKLLYSDIKL